MKKSSLIESITCLNKPIVLKNVGLEHMFDVVVFSQAAGIAKPNPEIFYQLLRKTGVEAGNAVHVGDDYKKDYRGALVPSHTGRMHMMH